MPLPDLDLLVAIVDGGSLTAAAEQLGMPRATVSRRLTRLEEEVGAVLVHRTTRQIAPTEAGMELYRHARPIVDAVATATASVRVGDGVPRGLLRVTLPPGGSVSFAGVLSRYLRACPEVRVEILAVTRHVDLVAEGFDVGIRAGELTGSRLVSRRLLGAPSVVVASPEYLAKHGTPRSAAELVDHDCFVLFRRGEVPVTEWPTRSGEPVSLRVRFASNDLTLITGSVVQGMGLALLPLPYAAPYLESGELVTVLTDEVFLDGGIWVVYPEKRLMLPRVRAFIDLLVEWAAEQPKTWHEDCA